MGCSSNCPLDDALGRLCGSFQRYPRRSLIEAPPGRLGVSVVADGYWVQNTEGSVVSGLLRWRTFWIYVVGQWYILSSLVVVFALCASVMAVDWLCAVCIRVCR